MENKTDHKNTKIERELQQYGVEKKIFYKRTAPGPLQLVFLIISIGYLGYKLLFT